MWIKLVYFTFAISCVFALSTVTQAAAKNPQHLNGGEPGCWKLIRQGALTQEEVNELSKACREFREDYFASIEAVKANPKTYEKKLITVLTQAKKSQAPYEAIFFATLIGSEPLKAALQTRADFEKKKQIPFAYASVAMYRLNGKDCTSDAHYANAVYKEICTAEDSILPVFAETKGGIK